MASTKQMQARARAAKKANKSNAKTGSPEWLELVRPAYVQMIKEDNQRFLDFMSALDFDALGSDTDKVMTLYKDADYQRMLRAVFVGTDIVRDGIATVAQVKDAAWEGFNGLLEACCVEMNIQDRLGLEISKINVNDFVFTGKDAVKQARKYGIL